MAVQKIIFDTDMGVDCDDAVALAILLNKHKRKQIELLAVTASSTREGATATVQAILDFYGVSVPVGAMAEPSIPCDRMNNYAKAVKEKYKTQDSTVDAVELLRKTLAEQNEKVTLIAVGPLSNIARLLRSGADGYSPLTGKELVKEKVDVVYIMGGCFAQNYVEGSPIYGRSGHHAEWNILQDVSSAQTVANECPAEMRFLPFEGGILAYTVNKKGVENPVYDSMTNYALSEGFTPQNHPESFLADGSFRRPSWDPVTCLCATEDCSKYFTLSPLGKLTIPDSGLTVWEEGEGNARFYILTDKFEEVASVVNSSIDPE
ncbi:MAG: nucleoside hydrolase [Clostridia bacterium]|nr:nucleoside hydrolase [Clostridia bacterium]